MCNPFAKMKNVFVPTKYIRECFDGKKAGDTFEVKIPEGYTLARTRGIMYHAMKKRVKYKTKVANGRLFVYIMKEI